MAVETRAWLFRDDLALGVRLIIEHVRVTALFPEVTRECVPRPELTQARILLETGLRHHRPRIRIARRAGHRLTSAIASPHLIDRATVRVVLDREVLGPFR